jgi:uncharacterized protein (DUF302 family)/uncharacterized membrane protein YidH (DUF202 family)
MRGVTLFPAFGRKLLDRLTHNTQEESKMDAPTEMRQKADLRDYLAAERTFLAWIRTGLALMGFGFVVARFGLFLQQFRIAQHIGLGQSYGLSSWFGTSLIAVGVFVNVFSGWRHARLIRELDRGDTARARPSPRVVVIAFLLALVGLAMAIYLVVIRNSAQSNSQNSEVISMALIAENGIISQPSHHSVDETVGRLKGILQAKGVTLFALVDHSGEAAKVGLKMPPTKLLIFGSPKAGTPLMLAAPSSAIDLPLKILVREDAQGKVWVAYNSPDYLQKRHGFPPELSANIAVVEALALKAAE